MISPVSFGKIVKISKAPAPITIAGRLADIINNNNDNNNASNLATELKDIFSDTSKGPARVFQVGDDIYIVSGEESEDLSKIYKTADYNRVPYQEPMKEYLLKCKKPDTMTVAHDGWDPKSVCIMA